MQVIGLMKSGRLDADIRFGDMLVHLILWWVLTVVTLGLALFYWPYSLSRAVLSRVYVLDDAGRRIAKLECPSAPGSDFIHALLWALLSLVTLGLAVPFYAYKVAGTVISRTKVLPLSAA